MDENTREAVYEPITKFYYWYYLPPPTSTEADVCTAPQLTLLRLYSTR